MELWNILSWEELPGIMEDQLQTSNRSAALCPCQHKVPLIGHKSTSQDPQTAGFPLHLLPVILSSVCEADFPLPGSCWGQQLSFLAKDTSKHTDRGVNSAAHSSPGKPWDGAGFLQGKARSFPKIDSPTPLTLSRAQTPPLAPGLTVGVEEAKPFPGPPSQPQDSRCV